jgi:hypothetical protein
LLVFPKTLRGHTPVKKKQIFLYILKISLSNRLIKWNYDNIVEMRLIPYLWV